MASDEARMRKRLKELSEQSRQKNVFLFSDFLTPLEASYVLEGRKGAGSGAWVFWKTDFATGDGESDSVSMPGRGSASYGEGVALWGGYPSAERVVARFGDPEDLGYEEGFPICLVRIEPLDARFSDRLTHRDFLGALVHLGIDRGVLGDILVKDGKRAYVFVLERMAGFIVENLTRVKHTPMTCELVSVLPEDAGPVLESRSVVVASSRADGVIAKLFNLSRSEAKDVFSRKEVFRNSQLCTNPSVVLEENDIISVRHRGKFVFCGVKGKTKKGNETVEVRVYV